MVASWQRGATITGRCVRATFRFLPPNAHVWNDAARCGGFFSTCLWVQRIISARQHLVHRLRRVVRRRCDTSTRCCDAEGADVAAYTGTTNYQAKRACGGTSRTSRHARAATVSWACCARTSDAAVRCCRLTRQALVWRRTRRATRLLPCGEPAFWSNIRCWSRRQHRHHSPLERFRVATPAYRRARRRPTCHRTGASMGRGGASTSSMNMMDTGVR